MSKLWEVETDTHIFFYGGIFSQWADDQIKEDGIVYNTAEQYMMAKKALCFGDKKRHKEIMEAKNPRDQKQLGKEVTPYVDEIWANERFNHVVKGNYLKFSQNLVLKKALLSTGDKIIVEASPYDRIWGIGLSLNNDRIYFEDKWLGQNLLGKAIMEAREMIRNPEIKIDNWVLGEDGRYHNGKGGSRTYYVSPEEEVKTIEKVRKFSKTLPSTLENLVWANREMYYLIDNERIEMEEYLKGYNESSVAEDIADTFREQTSDKTSVYTPSGGIVLNKDQKINIIKKMVENLRKG